MHGLASNRTVFISSTTFGLQPYREKVVELLKAHGIKDIEQRQFNPDVESVQDEIQRKICAATGVICLVGPYYGIPKEPMKADLSCRYSFTQWECLYAMRLGKEPRIFVLHPEFFVGETEVDEVERNPGIADAIFFKKWQSEFQKYLAIDRGHCYTYSPAELWFSLAKINWDKWPCA